MSVGIRLYIRWDLTVNRRSCPADSQVTGCCRVRRFSASTTRFIIVIRVFVNGIVGHKRTRYILDVHKLHSGGQRTGSTSVGGTSVFGRKLATQ